MCAERTTGIAERLNSRGYSGVSAKRLQPRAPIQNRVPESMPVISSGQQLEAFFLAERASFWDESQPVQKPVELASMDSEHAGRLGFVPLAPLEDIQNVRPLDRFEVCWIWHFGG